MNIREIVARALSEDLGTGDVTTQALFATTVHARGTSDGADVPARKEVAAASGEVVLLDPRMIVSLMPRPAYGAVAVTDSFSPGSLIGNAH